MSFKYVYVLHYLKLVACYIRNHVVDSVVSQTHRENLRLHYVVLKQNAAK